MRLVEEDEEEEIEIEEVESFSPIEEDRTAFIVEEEEEEEEEDPDADVTIIPNLGEEEVARESSLSPTLSRDAKTIAEDVLSRKVVKEDDEEGDTSQGLGISGAEDK